jgi:hypothetical protein
MFAGFVSIGEFVRGEVPALNPNERRKASKADPPGLDWAVVAGCGQGWQIMSAKAKEMGLAQG